MATHTGLQWTVSTVDQGTSGHCGPEGMPVTKIKYKIAQKHKRVKRLFFVCKIQLATAYNQLQDAHL